MSSHAKALDKSPKHSHKMGDDGHCTVCNIVMEKDAEADEKGKKPKEQYSFQKNQGAKNNDSEND